MLKVKKKSKYFVSFSQADMVQIAEIDPHERKGPFILNAYGTVNTMAVDDLVMQGARSSTLMVLT